MLWSHRWLLLVVLCYLTVKQTTANQPLLQYRCMRDLFRCNVNGACIHDSHVCDGNPDCPDGQDESDCDDPCENKFMCKNSDKCIAKDFLCDKHPDCPEGDDEDDQNCKVECNLEKDFRCRHRTNQCVSLSKVCDGNRDCKDGTDEAVEICHNATRTCNADEFMCDTINMCILSTLRCDGNPDCVDKSDEMNCDQSQKKPSSDGSKPVTGTNEACPSSTHFTCEYTKDCVPQSKLCDGNNDCPDGTDENMAHCPRTEGSGSTTSPCQTSTDFFCGEPSSTNFTRCIDRTWVCDGKRDCEDGSDETRCRPEKDKVKDAGCEPYEFRCASLGECIANAMRCDGHDDCMDKSDEANCPSKQVSQHCNASIEFDCGGDGKHCIPLSKVCDEMRDCPQGEDEAPGGSNKNCHVNPCAVTPGDKLFRKGNCSHTCVSHYFTRVCTCPPGYRLGKDQLTCVDINECIEVVGVCSQICYNIPGAFKCDCVPGFTKSFSDLTRCVATGEKFLYFSIGSGIREIRLLQHEMRPVLERQTLVTAIDFQYPPMGGGNKVNMIYTDVVSGMISRIPLYGNMATRKVEILFSGKELVAEGVAFDSVHGLLFWTDVGSGSISVMNVSSRARHVLVKEGVEKPRGIVADPEYRRIYWTDWGSHPKVESIGMDGEERRVLTTNVTYPNGLALDYLSRALYWGDSRAHQLVRFDLTTERMSVVLQHDNLHPFGVEVFEDRLYWTDWLAESVFSVNKFTGADFHAHIHARKPMGVRMLHEMRPPRNPFMNACKGHVCSHLCLPLSHVKETNTLYKCACSVDGGWSLAEDNITCIRDPSKATNDSFLASLASRTMPPGDSSNTPESVNVAGVVGGVMCAVMTIVVVTSVMAYVIYRNYMRTAMHSVQFENPVCGKLAANAVMTHPPRSMSAAADLCSATFAAAAAAAREGVYSNGPAGENGEVLAPLYHPEGDAEEIYIMNPTYQRSLAVKA